MYYIGLDLGQRRDHTAVAVVERAEPGYARVATGRLVVRHLQRAPLGTGYPAVGRGCARGGSGARSFAGASGSSGGGCDGAGRPGGRYAARRSAGVRFVGGDDYGRGSGSAEGDSAEAGFACGGQCCWRNMDLRIAKGIEMAGVLVKELMNVRMSAKGMGRYRVGADGSGQHDDLVVAVSLAVWRARGNARLGSGRGG